MPQRVVAQSGTFLVSGHLGLTVEQIIQRYPGGGVLLVQFVFDTAKVRAAAMASLYSMNITQATLFPGLDGLARSMAYEFEYSREIDPATNQPQESLQNPYLPAHVLHLGTSAVRGSRLATDRAQPNARASRRTVMIHFAFAFKPRASPSASGFVVLNLRGKAFCEQILQLTTLPRHHQVESMYENLALTLSCHPGLRHACPCRLRAKLEFPTVSHFDARSL